MPKAVTALRRSLQPQFMHKGPAGSKPHTFDSYPTMYFPQRTYKNRPYLTRYLEMAARGENPDLSFLIMEGMAETFGHFSMSEETPFANACRGNEYTLVSSLSRFFTRGQVVLHLQENLKQAFMRSDLGDAAVSDLQFPFDDFYMHFGKTGLLFNDGRAELEGVMVSRNAKTNDIELTLTGDLVEPPKHWGERGMETYWTYLSGKDADTRLLEAVDKNVKAFASAIKPVDFDEELYKEDGIYKDDIDGHAARRENLHDMHLANTSTVMDAVKLVANALLYLAQYPEDIEDGFEDGFPAGFKEKILRSDGKTRANTISKASRQGFTLIKKVGAKFERALLAEGQATSSGSPAPHLRRAHWRRQPYGPKASLRKLMWIRTTRVMGGELREKPYLVS